MASIDGRDPARKAWSCAFGHLTLALGLLFLLSSAACGDAAQDLKGDDQESSSEDQTGAQNAEDYLAQQETYIMPWTNLVDEELAEQATVEAETITFPADVVDELPDLERRDIVVSASPDAPFIRRIDAIDESGEELTLETEHAQLTEAVLKGSTGTGSIGERQPRDSDQQQSPLRPDDGTDTRRQPAGSGPNYESPGEDSSSTSSASSKTESSVNFQEGFTSIDANAYYNFTNQCAIGYKKGGQAGIAFRGDFDSTLGPRVHNKLIVENTDSGTRPQNNTYLGTRRCQTHDDCFQRRPYGDTDEDPSDKAHLDEHCYEVPDARKEGHLEGEEHLCGLEVPENHNLSYAGSAFQDSSDLLNCGQILAKLDVSRDYSTCQRRWEEWWNGGADSKRKCTVVTDEHAWFHDGESTFLAPYPVQVDWAKDNCQGGLQAFEFDMRAQARFALENNFAVKGKGELDVFRGDFEFDTPDLPSIKFFIGWFPVLITLPTKLTGSVAFTTEAEVGVGAKDTVALAEEGDASSPIDLKLGGLTYYASQSAAQEYGTRELWRNDSPEAGLRWNETGLDSMEFHGLEGDNWEFYHSGEATISMEIAPTLEALFYDAAGLVLQPVTAFYEMTMGADSPDCEVGQRAGFKGSIGVTAQMPFGSDELNGSLSGGSDEPECLDSTGEGEAEVENPIPTTYEYMNTCQPTNDWTSLYCRNNAYCDPGPSQCPVCWNTCLQPGNCSATPSEDLQWVKLEAPDDPDTNPTGKYDPVGIELDQLVAVKNPDQPDQEIIEPVELVSMNDQRSEEFGAGDVDAITDGDFQCDGAEWVDDRTCRGCYTDGCYDSSSQADYEASQCSSKARNCSPDGSEEGRACHYSFRSENLVTFHDGIKVRFEEAIPQGAEIRLIRLDQTQPTAGASLVGGPEVGEDNEAPLPACASSGKVQVAIGTSEHQFGSNSSAVEYNQDLPVQCASVIEGAAVCPPGSN